MKLKQFIFALVAMLSGFAFTANAQVAKVGNTEYATIDEAISNWTNGTTLTLLADVQLSGVVKINSNESRTLDLGTFTMTAAKNQDAFQYVVTGSTSDVGLSIKADATNPGGINASGKAIIRHTKPLLNAPSKDRPYTQFFGGVFNASYIVYQGGAIGAGYTGASAPRFVFHGGEFNGTIYANRSKFIFNGGTFNGNIQISVDSSADALVKGGKFKNLSNSFGSELNSDKFTIGSSAGTYDREVYVDENGYYVISASEPAEGIEADVAKTPGTNDYFAYSKVATDGQLGYTDVEMALKNNTSATVTVYADEVDMTGINFSGTIIVPEGNDITITNAPSTIKVQLADGTVLTPDANGNVTTVLPVAQIGEQKYATLDEAITAAQNGEKIILLADVELTAQVVIPEGKELTLDLNGKTVNSVFNGNSTTNHIYALSNKGTLTINDSKGNGSINSRGIYNYGSLTLNAGAINAIDGNGGYAVNNQNGSTFVMNGGVVAATYEDDHQSSSGGYDATALKVPAGCTATLNGGTINNVCDFTYAIDAAGTLNIPETSAITVNGTHGAIYVSGGETTINAGTFQIPADEYTRTDNVLYVSGGSLVVNGGTFIGDSDTASGGSCLSDAAGKAVVNGGTFKGSSGGDVWGTTGTTIKGGTFENLTEKQHIAEGYELNADGTVVAKPVAEVNGVKYTTLAEAVAAAQAGSEIKLLADIEGDITLPAGITFNGSGFAVSGAVTAAGEITFAGVTKVGNFGVQYVNTTVNIPAGASLQLTGTGRMVIGHGCTFNITGTIADAKTANVADVTPSLVMPGASFTGAGVTFNVTNAYIKTTASYCSSSKSASGIFDFNITNSIWEQFGKLAFESQSTAATVNFDLVNSVLNTGSHLVFGVSRGEVVIDNSNVNVGKSNQIENQSTMTIKNGSVVNGLVATSSNAKNPGTVIVENATYAVTGEFSGSDLGTGTLIIKKGANVSVGSITTGANITVDAEGMTASDVINFTANLSKFAGTLSVINNDKLEAQIVDGKVVLAAKPVAKIGEQGYATLDEAFAAAAEGETITLLDDATPALTSQRAITKAAVIDLGGKTLTLTEDDLYFGTTTFKNGTIVVDPSVKASTAVFWMFANQTLTFDNVKIVATGVTGTYLIGLDGNNSDLNLLNGSEILVENTTALDLDIICVNASTGNDIKVENSKVNVTNLDGRVFFRGNYTVKDSEVNLAGITKAGFRIEAGQTLSIEGTSVVNIEGEPRDGGIHMTDLSATYTKAETATVNATLNRPAVAKIGDTPYYSLSEAVAAAQNGEKIILIDNVVLAERVTIPADKTLTIDLNGKSISMEESIIATAYAINNLGNLTITDGVGGGSINARGVYNGYGDGGANVATAKITVVNGTINAKGTNGGGAAIFNYGVADIQGGTFTSVASYAIALQTGSTMTIGENAIITGGINSWQSTLTITGGTISNDKSGKHVVYAGESTVAINGGTFHNNNSGNATIMASGSTAAVEITGGTFTLNIVDASSSYLIDATSSATYTISGGSFTGGIRAQGGTKYEIAGGTFTNEYGNYNVYEGGDINISGGTFTGSYAQKFATDNLAAGYELGANGTVVQVNYVAQIGEKKYVSLADALEATKTMTGDVTVEILDKVTFNQPLIGSYSSINFVGKAENAEMYLDVQGYTTATGKKVSFTDLKLSKSEGGFIANAGFMNVAFGIYDVEEVTYTNCTFENGACASSGKVTFNGCTFKKSWDKYGLWAYGNVDVTVQGSTFADYRGIKMYAENGADASVEKANLTVKNTNFSAVNNKPAIVLTYGESVVLEGNTYSSTGTFELDLDGKPNGVAVTSDVAPVCVNDNGACGVLVDGKIYTTVAQAAEVATETSTVTLLHSSNETVEFPMGTTIDKNGFTADNVTTAQPFADYVVLPHDITVNNYKALFGTNTVTDGTNYYATLQAAVEAVAKNAGVTRQANAVLYCKPGADVGSLQHAPVVSTLTVYGNGANVTGGSERDFDLGNTDPSGGKDITADMTLTVKHLNGCGAWGAKATEHTVNLVFENCANMGKVFITGTTGTLNITMNDCAFEGIIKEAVYSNADGAITLNNVAFSNLNKAINLNHKAAGTQTVTINGCSFTNCGADVAADQIPVRVLSSVEGGKSVLNVSNATFSGTPTGGADILLDYGVGVTEAAVENTSANVHYEQENNVPVKETVSAGNSYEFTTAKPVAKIGDTPYYSLSEAFAAVTDDAQTVVILQDVTEELTGAYLRGNITTENGAKVTINLTNTDWVYCPYTFVLGENITLNVPYLFYYAGGAQINGTVVAGAYYQRYGGTKLTVNEPGSLTVTSEMCYIRYTDGDANAGIYVNGDNNNETVGLNLSVAYFYQGMIYAKDANIKTAVYWQTNETDGQGSANLVLDNSTLNVTVNEQNFKATGNSTVTLTNGSSIVVAGAFETGSNTKVSVDATSTIIDKNGVVAFITGEGTDANPYIIDNAAELVLFRNSVNAGETKYNAEGVCVALGADIDLAGIDWSVNIGDDCAVTFDGIFDGKGFTISNLTSTETAKKADGYICTGLFGAIYDKAVVKNFTINNVTIDAQYVGNNVAAVVGFAYNSKGSIENVKVTGNININAPLATGVGTIVGYDYYSPSLKVENCEVIGNDGSAIVASAYVGGLVGYASSKIAMNNNTVENISITATGSVAGVAGIMLGGSSATGNTVKNVSVVANGALWANSAAVVAGTIDGGAVTVSGTTVENVTANGAEARLVGGALVEKPTTAIAKVAARIGDKYYKTLINAVEAAQTGDEIVLIADVTTVDGVVITDKNLTIDLNGKTYTVTEGANTNNRNFKINGASVVTVKNGTMVAAGEYSSGAYGTIRTEGTANVTLTGLKLYNYRGNGLNIKACTGTTVTVDNTEIYANYGGGIEAAGGTIVVNDGVTVKQEGMYTAPYNSMAISVNGGGKVTVNGGTFSTECITAEEANNQGASHGPWVAGVLNSGGTLIINGGTFSNDNFGENSLATAARGAILADTKAKVEINGGTFNVLKNVIDIQNNLGDVNNNPSVVLAGGTYNADPRVSAQYGSNLITLADGYVCQANNDGTYGVVEVPTDVKVATLAELQAALADNSNELPIIITAQIVIPADETVTIDLNGKTVTVVYQENSTTKHIYSLDNYGTLTIKDTKGNGSINSRGIFVQNGSKLTVESGSIYGIDSNGGSALYQYGGDIVINGGHIEQKAEGTYNFAINALGGTVTVNGGKIAGNHGAIAAGGATVVINDGELVCTGTAGMTDNVLYTYDNGTITINGGTFVADNDGPAGGCCVYDANGKATINGGTFSNSSGGDVWGTTGTTIKGGTFENLTETQHIADGYELDENGTVVQVNYAAKIGETKYATLQAAIENVQEGETITVLEDITFTTGANGSTNGISYTRGASFTLDLNGKTITSNLGNNALRFKIGDGNSVVNTEVTIEIKNGKIVSGANNWCAISAATADNSGNKLILNLTDLAVEANKGGDFAVKSWAGAVVNAENVDVTANYAGGFYAVGGEIVLDENSSVAQKGLHTAPYMSYAFGVSSGTGKMTINGGIYSAVPAATADAYNQGASHGSSVGGVMSSGGTLIINGGTFSNDNFGDAAPTAPRSLIMADAGAVVTINGGTFNAMAKIVDPTNNTGDASKNAVVTIAGGTYSANPTDAPYNLVKLAEDYVAVENNGVWNVVKAAAKIGEQAYKTLEDAFKAATSGCTIEILSDVIVDYYWDARNTGAKFTVPVTINGNGNTIKFTNTVYDGGNYMSAFRFEADAVVNNLTIDMSEAISGFAGRFRAISAKANLTVDGCTFIGNGYTNNTRAIIFGEGASATDLTISITNSTFNGWRRGISDNEAGKDVAATVTVTGNTLTDAGVAVSANTAVAFTGNTVSGAYVDIRSYTTGNSLNVTATGNTLEANTDKSYNYIKAGGDINAQDEFVLPTVAISYNANGDEVAAYSDFESAIAAASANTDIVRIEVVADYHQKKIANVENYYDIKTDLVIASAEENNYTLKGCGFAVRVQGNVTFTIAENLTIEGLDVVANGFATSGENMVVDGTLKAVSLKQWTSNGTITVNGKVELGYGDGQFDMAYGNGAVVVNGNGDRTVAQFKAGYSGARGNGGVLTLNDTYFEAGAWFNVNGSNTTINVNNSLLKVTGGDFVGALTLATSNVINIDINSQVVAGAISGAGTINIDADEFNGEAVTVIKADMSGFTGEINVAGEGVIKEMTAVGVVIKADPNYIAELEIIDGEYGDYTNDGDKTVGKLTYVRTLPAAGIWYPVFLPFDVPVGALAENFDVARINDLHTDFSEEDGSIKKMWIEYIVRKSGTLAAGKPFLVRAKSSEVLDMEIELENVTLYASSKKNSITVSSAITKVTFEGVYEATSGLVSTPSTRYMAVNANGVWDEFDGYPLNPFRVLMTLEILDEEYYVASAASLSVGARVIGEENEDGTTTIYDVEADREENDMIFDLQGRRVLETEKGGIYIKNGKKFIVK